MSAPRRGSDANFEAVPCGAYYHHGNIRATGELPTWPNTSSCHVGKMVTMVARIKLDAAPKAEVHLAKWRETKFSTQQELADAMNTTAAAVSRIETGERDWSKGYLEALAYLVGCQVGDLFHHPDIVRGKPKPDIVRDTPKLEELMRLVSSLSDEQTVALISLFGKNKAGVPHEAPVVEDPQALPATEKSA